MATPETADVAQPVPSSVHITTTPAIKNAPFPAEGNGYFSNKFLAFIVLAIPWLIKRSLPLVRRGGWTTYWVMVAILGLPITVAYWQLTSMYGPRLNQKLAFPGRPIEDYLEIKDPQLKKEYNGNKKIPIQTFYDAYFAGKIEFKGDPLDVLEYRHDWAKFTFTFDLWKDFWTRFIPEVILHSQSQDEEQVRDHYDRGDDFYEWFLGPRMVYTSGVVTDITREETLEELQDNKLSLVCEKLDLKETDTVLDIGCGWGTLAAFASKNYGCDVTGITLGRNQTAFGNKRIADNGVSSEKARILCMDYREIPNTPGHYTKIVSLEMAEHVGVRRYSTFLRQIYDLLDDNGLFVLQVAGFRPRWQFEDLLWGMFMNKYVFPGADASIPLNWVLKELEVVGFEVKSVDVLGVHYSATLWRWYKNWLSNEEKVLAKYGDRWNRIWKYFLASATIASRQGSASVFQITLHKNLNAFPRIEGVPSHLALHHKPKKAVQTIV
ncbi:S-adenosyl-L-methionine-dependent methyltransferase [Calocera cornea HHB12733]|uniref:sphingolipid C(9)-methyltransferase n=1 Tax=Calocera cornea HHB12733 TaxID=1353952 RepID=A0A165D9G4_9BASI|nr:S-adenosyl-L-methionine-dependent methyltransferase [Calocera cornea HHB12733]